MIEVSTKIDARCRPGCLTGIVRPGELYAVKRLSPVEVRLTLIEPVAMPQPRLGKSRGRTVSTGGRGLTAAEVEKELENFP